MKRILIAALVVGLAGCSSPEQSPHDELMDVIEAQVRLPEGARHLDDYSRYYAESDDGRVTAVYLIPLSMEAADEDECEEISEDGSGQIVPCPSMNLPWQIPAGQRRWLDTEADLPFINDGGCSQVTVTFDRATSRVSAVNCNGIA
jgi:hypothetical protein